MLPDSSINSLKAATEPYMFVDTGVPRLFKAVYDLGGDRSRVVIKVAGGAAFFDPNGSFNIGERNMKALQALLARNGHAIASQDVGGTCSRTMRLDLATGDVCISSPALSPYRI
jgi:chemotaxis protein CheD